MFAESRERVRENIITDINDQGETLAEKKNNETRKVTKLNEKQDLALKQILSIADAVTQVPGKSGVYKFCPECNRFVIDKFKRHLKNKHELSNNEAQLMYSKYKMIYLWVRHESQLNIQFPVPCYECCEWCLGIDHHSRNCKKHAHMTSEERRELVSKTKEECWASGHQESNSSKTKSLSREDEENAFVYRSKSNNNILPILDDQVADMTEPSAEYTPCNAKKLTRALFKKWCIRENDYFTIYYESVQDV